MEALKWIIQYRMCGEKSENELAIVHLNLMIIYFIKQTWRRRFSHWATVPGPTLSFSVNFATLLVLCGLCFASRCSQASGRRHWPFGVISRKKPSKY